ncbi:ABC transporter ATP-binding protein [Salinispira pacifica]|uniref:Oligopeptide transport ATP-binding protein OppD n=1 Tax=Salinispira pacifica TaxID=1307761 RepID=V5WKX2_9SPIO|nr:ABC transporter ATP-binding protein [Salinispira pacifica]AHC16398.1 Oligopeptide transport ATP-binding protein OppD [Salinispira pacifica]
MKPLLEIENLRTYFFMPGYVVRAVDGISFTVHEGETVGIVGESGCGKSQTSMSVMGLVPSPPGKIVDGSIKFRGKDLTTLPEDDYRKIRGNDISMIFQEPMTSLNPVFTVGYQITEALMLHRQMTEADAMQEAERLLKLVGMSDPGERLKEYPFQLSGGLRQRVMIAIAMACQPRLMIADEPTTALDVTIQAQILRLMKNLTEEQNMATMFITHDLAVIASFTKRVIVMYAGVIVEDSPVMDIFAKPLHPYTQGLLGSIPVLGQGARDDMGKRQLLNAIPGSLPDPKNITRGCKFASRCPKAMKKCWEAEPALVETEKGRKVRCFLYNDEVRESGSIIDLDKLTELGGKAWRKEYDRHNNKKSKKAEARK